MKKLLKYWLLLLIVSSAYGEAPNAADLFVRAIKNHSTAPNYVLITVVNDNTKEARLICTEAPFLLGAICKEHQISHDNVGILKAEELTLAQKDRIFHFSSTEALKNIEPRYDEKILSEMRIALKDLSGEQIKLMGRGLRPELDKLYQSKSFEQWQAYRDALAHVLLERGLLPRRGCRAGNLTIDE